MAILCYPNSNSNSNSNMYWDLQVKCTIFLPDFNQILFSSTDFHESPQYQISRKSVQWEPRVLKTEFPIFVTSAVFIHHGLFFWRDSPQWAMASSFTSFLDHTQRRTTVGRTPLYEWSARPIDLYLTTHDTHNRHTSMTLVGFEPTISAGERPQTCALDRAATGTGSVDY